MNLLILRKGPTQRLEHTLSAEKMYLINFTERTKKIIKFKSNDPEVLRYSLCLGIISRD